MKIEPFPDAVLESNWSIDKKGFLKDNSDGRAAFHEKFLTQKSFSEVFQYYSMKLRKEGWECVDSRGEYEGGFISYTFKRKGDDFHQWFVGIKKEDINKNKSQRKKEGICYSVGIDFR